MYIMIHLYYPNLYRIHFAIFNVKIVQNKTKPVNEPTAAVL